MKIVKKDKYEVGDVVKVIDHRGDGWSFLGGMDYFIGGVHRITEIWDGAHKVFCRLDNEDWVFSTDDFEGAVITEQPIQRSEFKNAHIYLKNGNIIDLSVEKMKAERDESNNDLIGLEWTVKNGTMKPLYLRLNDISAITVEPL